MYAKIYEKIEEFDTIVIARHIGVDPDALCSQLALRDAIKLTFPQKKVLAIGSGSTKFSSIGKLDKLESISHALLIITDTPDKKRVDSVDFSQFDYSIKIDHHPHVETFCDLELIEDSACSVCEIIMKILLATNLNCNKEIAEKLFMGVASDSNRFLFNSCTSETFNLVAHFIKEYNLDISKLYQILYLRPLNEVRLEGYILTNLIVTKNNFAYINITDDLLKKYNVDSAAAGNMINNFNNINEIIVWATLTEDIKNKQIRVSIRSRGPDIKNLAEKYHGGGHNLAAGVKLKSFEESKKLLEDLDLLVKEYNSTKEKKYDNKKC